MIAIVAKMTKSLVTIENQMSQELGASYQRKMALPLEMNSLSDERRLT